MKAGGGHLQLTRNLLTAGAVTGVIPVILSGCLSCMKGCTMEGNLVFWLIFGGIILALIIGRVLLKHMWIKPLEDEVNLDDEEARLFDELEEALREEREAEERETERVAQLRIEK